MTATKIKTPRLKQVYTETIRPALKEASGRDNPMALPTLQKIVISVGLGKQLDGTKLKPAAREQTLKDLALISGQKAIMLKARKSVANFKVREGYEVGAMVTLRGERMWEFLDRLVSLALPRIKDFRGLNDKSFDNQGNYSFGLTEQGLFPEVNMAEAQHTFGMHVTLQFRNSTPELTREFLNGVAWPFIKRETKKR